jgi:methionyl-tRNA formyltransferase
MNIGFLANSQLAIPTLKHLLEQQKLCAVGIPAQDNEYTQHIQLLTQQHQLEARTLERKHLQADVTAWVQENELDVVLVYTFPWRIPEACLGLPRRGFYNAHFAPLPRYRGANPLFWLIRNRAPRGGFYIHEMTASLDDGPVVYQQELPLSPRDTLGLHMSQLSLAAVRGTEVFLGQLAADTLVPQAQSTEEARAWPAPGAEDLIIDWATQTATEVNALIKATNPHYGGAITFYQGMPLRILDVTILDGTSLPIGMTPGTILNDQTGTVLFVACRNQGLIRVDVIKLEEGYFAGAKLFELGVQAGTTFSTEGLSAPSA